ncbi:MAG: hypothetical protein RSC84_03440 [Peptostreptococcaceae bacterium]
MHRTDSFDYTTPKYLFEQQEVYMKVNGLLKEDNQQSKNQLNSVEEFF